MNGHFDVGAPKIILSELEQNEDAPDTCIESNGNLSYPIEVNLNILIILSNDLAVLDSRRYFYSIKWVISNK